MYSYQIIWVAEQVIGVYFSEYLLFAYQAVWVLKSKVFAQKSTVVKWNYQILCLHLLTILDFQSEFSTSKIVRIFFRTHTYKY